MRVTQLADYRPKNSTYNYAAYRDRFFRWLEEQEKSYHTMKNYLCDLDAFAKWFKGNQREELSPPLVTSIDLREYKQHLVTLNFKPQSGAGAAKHLREVQGRLGELFSPQFATYLLQEFG